MRKWVFIGAVASRAMATCYYPDGSNAAKDYKYEPCGNSTTIYSTCCYFGEGDKCLANGLCNQPGKWDYRAACQNKDWSNCPEVCMDTDSGTWFGLQTCGKNKYCCPPADGSDCCDSGAQIYTLKAADPSSTKTSDATSTFQSVIRTTIIQTPTSSADRGGNSVKKSSTPAIVGGTVGGVSFIGFLFLGVFCVYKRRDRPDVPHTEAVAQKKDDESGGKGNATVQVLPQVGVAEAEGTEGDRYNEVDSRAVNVTRPPLAYPEDDGMPQPADITLPQQPYPEHDNMPRVGRQNLRTQTGRHAGTEADSNPILHADSNPILHADSNPILQADSNPILQADSNPINEAPDDAWVRPRIRNVPKSTTHELP
ncbi:hypothetical protein FBEOM_7185 [Fusarium beomiforme]|uniref:Uncharacterized protein n=1 Tax=Fusarium beomiforme TaxID=44412 RepID=A0A9P5DVG7_9HYPO|nr:hypothetical protein FBEOM_7185 [Fusarium beomiforme]